MLVRFRTNLGLFDAKAVGLDYKECLCDKIADVPAEVAKKLVKSGAAEQVKQAEAVKGIEKEPAVKGVKSKDEAKQ